MIHKRHIICNWPCRKRTKKRGMTIQFLVWQARKLQLEQSATRNRNTKHGQRKQQLLRMLCCLTRFFGFWQMLNQRSPRSASPPPRGDAPVSSSSGMASPGRASPPPEAPLDPPRCQSSPQRAPSPTCSSGSAPKEILSLEELFPLGSGASQASSQGETRARK